MTHRLVGGVGLGLVLMVAATRTLGSVLTGFGSIDVPSLAVTVATPTIVSAVAVAGPAWKAARIDPIEALRGE